MKFKLNTLAVALAGAAALALTGCGGGGGDGSATGTTAVTVSPSLGKFSDGAHVTLKKPDGTVLGTADIAGGTGTAAVSIPSSYSGPILVEVTGKDDGTGTYYDEGTKTNKPFGKAEKLRAFASAVLAAVGVTPATNAAVVELETAKGGLTTVTANDIAVANNKIQVALGLTDLLQAPTLVDGTTAASLDLAKPGDVYALVLAALAKTAGTGKTALDVAKSLADDLSDGQIDGKKGTTALTDPAYAPSTFAADMAAEKLAAAADLANADSKNIISNLPTALGSIDTDVTGVTSPSDGGSSTSINTVLADLQKAKAFFTELRTALITTFGINGFLDTQALKASNDLKATIGPNMDKVANRIDALILTTKFYESVKGGYGYSLPNIVSNGTDPVNSKPAYVYTDGNINAVWYGGGSYNKCWIDTDYATSGALATCANFSSTSADYANSRFKFVLYAVGPAATSGQYAYTATRYNQNVAIDGYGNVTTPGQPTLAKNSLLSTSGATVYVPTGAGTFSMTYNGTLGQITAGALTGTLPSSTSICVAPNANSISQQSLTCPTGQIEIPGTAPDAVTINFARSALTGSNFHYALSGSVSTANAVDTTKVSSLAIGSGSYFDLDETYANTTGKRMTGAQLIGTVQTAANKFTGTVTIGSFMNDKNGQNYQPTHIAFDGSISDISTGGAGQYLTGNLTADEPTYSTYDSLSVGSATNYHHAALVFTGTVQAPSRPLMSLTMSATQTGLDAVHVTLNYSYGTVSITGSGNSTPGGVSDLSLSNQDGVVIAPDPANTNQTLATKSGSKLATIIGNVINYIDGSSASLN
ncbi:hypothetical protein [Rhodoferax sp.]|uniref:hypothetical protein n=1 Tax=Rhodoferax sp. TaxID=50421 RepID=UPI00284AB6A5|nr:hypothetical protein [Rhodoferax sp.]MDR3367590.1 hypothetical protein [Rhodoferax sp.]